MHDLFREADRLMAVTFQKEGSPPHHYHYPSLLTFKEEQLLQICCIEFNIPQTHRKF